MMRASHVASLAVLTAMAASPGASRAQECALPDLEHSVPLDGASGVPTDALLRGRYAASAEYRGEVVVLHREGEPEASVEGEWLPAERSLLVEPPEALVAGARYVLRWPALRDVEGEVLGTGAAVTFTVGGGPDRGPPTFGGVEALSWDARKIHDDCVGSAEERYLFDFRVGGASDDSGPGTLEALVYQSSGPALAEDDPPPLVAALPMPEAGGELSIRLPREQSLGEVCFVVLVRDLAGSLSGGGEPSCVETERPPFFGGCAVAPADGPSGPAALAALAGLLLLAARRRERLTPRRRAPRSGRGVSATRSRGRRRRAP